MVLSQLNVSSLTSELTLIKAGTEEATPGFCVLIWKWT